jgi:membrane protein YdbS with pleckstrin-like domain
MLDVLYKIGLFCDWVIVILGLIWVIFLLIVIEIGIIKSLIEYCKWIYDNLAKITHVIMKDLK